MDTYTYNRVFDELIKSSTTLSSSTVYLGWGVHVEIFRAFFLSKDDPNDWNLLIDFYNAVIQCEPQLIDINLNALLSMLYWCRLDQPFHYLFPNISVMFCYVASREMYPELTDLYFDFLENICEQMLPHFVMPPSTFLVTGIDLDITEALRQQDKVKVLQALDEISILADGAIINMRGTTFINYHERQYGIFRRFIDTNIQLIKQSMTPTQPQDDIEHAAITLRNDE